MNQFPQSIKNRALPVVFAKIDYFTDAIDLLLQAWQLSNQANDQERAKSIIAKIVPFTDLYIAKERANAERFETEWANSVRFDAKCRGLVNLAKEIVDLEQYIDSEQGMNPDAITDEELAYDNWCRLSSNAPIYLEESFASLKLEKKDRFAAILHRQVNELISFGQKYYPIFIQMEEYRTEHLFDHLKTLVSAGTQILGSEHPEIIEIKKAMKEFAPVAQFDCEEPSLRRKEAEADYLALLTASRETPVKEILQLLENAVFRAS